MKGLIEIFYEPGKVFDYVREQRAWLTAFFAGLLLFVLVFAYSGETIGWGNITRRGMESNKFAAQMPQEQKDLAIAKADTTAGKVQTLGFTVVGYAVITIIFGLLVMAIAGVSGGPLKFSQAMGVVTYSGWPIAVLRSILSIIVIALAADKADLDPQHLLAFNLGAFLDKATTNKALYSLASSLDLFIFASMAFGAFGLARVAKISFTKAMVGVVLIWVVFTALGMGLSLVF